MRIISTVPSITELLSDLGLEDEVIGITKFCVHPYEWYKSKTRIGGTKSIDIEKVKTLSPDLVIANKEENVKEQIEALEAFSEVLVTDIKKPEDNLELISKLGELTNKRLTAIRLRQELQAALDSIPDYHDPLPAAYLIWKDPYMTIGADTYIHAIMKKCGLQNIYSPKTRYPETTLLELKKLQPKVILLSSEPFPFKEKHIEEISAIIPETTIALVDGEAFSWYGTRLTKTAPYLSELISSFNQA